MCIRDREKRFIFIEDQIDIPILLKSKYPRMEIFFAKYGYGLDSGSYDFNEENFTIMESPKEILKNILNKIK